MSNKPEKTFVEQVLEGDVLDTEIDDFVDRWHESEGGWPLHEYLGFTLDEYALWVEQPGILPFIISSKKYGIPFDKKLDWDEAHALAARSQNQSDTAKLIKWLEKTGRLG